MSNSVRTIVVFESRPRWEPELQRQFRNESVRVRGCRSLSELFSFVFPPIVDALVIDLPEDITECLQWLSKLVASPKVPSVIVLCPTETAGLEWTLRDVGVREVLVGDLSGEQLARTCRRMISSSE
ncbi:MAG: hypothetical protein DWI21_04620 [Planctomycetota bacterium]|nr:MAG: hypothetical protein DWI21_04620 [Planctomycetota bacterium]GDY06702.1 hypothetical protein LBMAG52_01880 [Planctomycetia bacterium]